jgi:hypothetical protein
VSSAFLLLDGWPAANILLLLSQASRDFLEAEEYVSVSRGPGQQEKRRPALTACNAGSVIVKEKGRAKAGTGRIGRKSVGK